MPASISVQLRTEDNLRQSLFSSLMNLTTALLFAARLGLSLFSDLLLCFGAICSSKRTQCHEVLNVTNIVCVSVARLLLLFPPWILPEFYHSNLISLGSGSLKSQSTSALLNCLYFLVCLDIQMLHAYYKSNQICAFKDYVAKNLKIRTAVTGCGGCRFRPKKTSLSRKRSQQFDVKLVNCFKISAE